tara:strand:+ start:114 stop:800 length:687 start_codon:yes stop_codon:yes gene_type:complete
MENKIIIPLDLDHSSAINIAKKLNPDLCRLKVGSQLFTSSGPKIISELNDLKFDIFLDLKFYDIPNTVYESVKSAVDLGVWMVNVHASGGAKMLESAKKAIESANSSTILIAVTILTSFSKENMENLGISDLDKHILNLGKLAYDCGLDGVVCASTDTQSIKKNFGKNFLAVTPGIRPAWSSLDDQSRVSTPVEALRNGSDFLVIGRPITGSKDPVKALERIYKEMDE